jgi:hypothetical protein
VDDGIALFEADGLGDAKGKFGAALEVWPGRYPVPTFQYSSTTLYQFSYHIQ